MENQYPILEYDDENSMITPALSNDLLRPLDGIDVAVITFYPDLDQQPIVKELEPLYVFKAGAAAIMQYVYKNSFVVANCPLGAPIAAGLMEELISLGITRFLCIGSAGLIEDSFDPKKLLIVTEAIRDEGTSYQYIPAEEPCYTSILLREQFKDCLDEQGVPYQDGKVWTTDCIYRETPSRVARRKAAGAVAVDMECSAFCAVAQRRGVEFAQALYFSDFLLSEVWSGFVPNQQELKKTALDILLKAGMSLSRMF